MNYEYKRTTAKVRQLDGTYKRKGFYAHTQKELKEKIRLAQEKAEKDYELSLNPFFNGVADEWNEAHEKEVAYNTWQGYQAPLKDLKARFESYHLCEVTLQDLQNLLNDMKSQGFARQTINLRKIVASLIFDFAVLKGYIDNSPCRYLKVPKNAPHRPRELPKQEDIDKVMKAKGKFGDYARFLYFTGVRRNEALALTKDDIQDGYILINKTLVWYGNKPKIKSTPKTSSGVRKIPIVEPLKPFLSNHKGNILFKGNNGYMLLSEFEKGWRKFQNENDLTITAHQLRHGFATLCYEAQLDEKEASELLGHSSIEVTKDIYTHISEQKAKITAEKLNQFVNKSVKN